MGHTETDASLDMTASCSLLNPALESLMVICILQNLGRMTTGFSQFPTSSPEK